jgi:hypothetical protein
MKPNDTPGSITEEADTQGNPNIAGKNECRGADNLDRAGTTREYVSTQDSLSQNKAIRRDSGHTLVMTSYTFCRRANPAVCRALGRMIPEKYFPLPIAPHLLCFLNHLMSVSGDKHEPQGGDDQRRFQYQPDHYFLT